MDFLFINISIIFFKNTQIDYKLLLLIFLRLLFNQSMIVMINSFLIYNLEYFFLHRYPEKKTRISYRQFSQPRTETIVYNRLVKREKNTTNRLSIIEILISMYRVHHPLRYLSIHLTI
jgi:hypothetical protein